MNQAGQKKSEAQIVPVERVKKNRWRRLLVFLAVAYVCVSLILALFQERFVFPGSWLKSSEPPVLNRGQELTKLKTASGQDTAVLFSPIKQGTLDTPTVLLFYGNGMTLADSLVVAEQFNAIGANAAIVEYPGFGMAKGGGGGRAPSEQDCYEAADAALAYLLTRSDINPDRLFAGGWSLGSAVAADLAVRHPQQFRGLILMSPFTSMSAMANRQLPIFPTSLILRHRFDTLGKLQTKGFPGPVLLLHSREDSLIPVWMSGELAMAVGHRARLHELTVGDHNEFFQTTWQQARDLAEAFIEENNRPPEVADESTIRPEYLANPPRVQLLTIWPGKEVWEKFGHNMLIVSDPVSGLDVAFDWGVFDFNQPFFISNFVRGRMLYSSMAYEAKPLLEFFKTGDRRAYLQDMKLTPEQAVRVARLCQQAVAPDEDEYRYHYFKDNCSTRLMGVLNKALEGKIKQELTSRATTHSYRAVISHYSGGTWLHPALMFIFGPSVDEPLNAQQDSFIPMHLAHHLQELGLTDGAGVELAPQASGVGEALRPFVDTGRLDFLIYLTAGLVYAGLIALAAIKLPGKFKTLGCLVLLVPWLLLSGAGGLIGLFVWFLTDHTDTAYNASLLQWQPIGWAQLLLVLLLPIFRTHFIEKWGWRLFVLAPLLSLIGLLVWAVGLSNQDNLTIIAVSLPVHVAGLLAYYHLIHRVEVKTNPT